MAVNLSKNGPALIAAYKKVVDTKSATDWALFTYEGNSNDLRLDGTGGGGLEELVEELNSGKVMYAFCRVPDPNSGLAKYVLINWTGEGVKDSRKGMCANHLSSIGNFLKGAHVTINARTEEDVEPDIILNKVAKASGANYNFHKQQKYIDAPRGPVGSVYKKVNAVEELQQTNKDTFWDQAQRDEEVRRKEDLKRAEQEREKLERERRELDEKQAMERERRTKDKAHHIELERTLQKKRDEEEREKEQRLGMPHQQNTGSKIALSSWRQSTDEPNHETETSQRSVYKKINALDEIKQTNKDTFWDQAQRDEEVRRKEDLKRAEQEREKLERERRELDEKQAMERERRTKDKAHQIELERTLQKKRDEEEREKEQRLGMPHQLNTGSKIALSSWRQSTEEPNHETETSQRSVYKKINALDEIKKTNKDTFWDQAQRDEEVRRKEDLKRAEQEREKLERERRELDEKQAMERERRTKDKAHQIELERTLQKKRDEEEREREQQQLNQQENTRKITGINAAASVQKANEAKSLISQRAFNPRDMFKQKEQGIEINNRSSHVTSQHGKLQSPFLSQKSFETEAPEKPQSPEFQSPFSSVTPKLPVFPAFSVSPTPPEATGLHELPAEEGSTEEAEWSDEFDDDADDNTQAESPVQENLYETPEPVDTAEDLYENVYQDETKAQDYNLGDGGQMYRARALYDYQAADDSEISFDPDDIITEIDMLDEGWWRGSGPDGHYGLFPANYVELISD